MSFTSLNLNKQLLEALLDLNITTPTTIQQKAFAPIMSGQDIVGIAQTGTGKTFAYLLPSLRMWQFNKVKQLQILILVPTRELVVQICNEVEKLTKYQSVIVEGVYGGTNINTQAIAVNKGIDILVATPGRFLDLALNYSLKLKSVKKLVIDEVDEMLDLGFRPQLERVIELLPNSRQNLMFSATMTPDVEILIQHYFKNPLVLEASPTGTPVANIIQIGYSAPNFYSKVNLLAHLINTDLEMNKVMVFVKTKKQADLLYELLQLQISDPLAIIHSNKSQQLRFEAVNAFKRNEVKIIIATDIVSRGIDINEVTHVINFDMHEVPENYIHRIGRTGRIEKKGIAISFVTPAEKPFKLLVEDLMKMKIKMKAFPKVVSISKEILKEEMPNYELIQPRIKLPKVKPSGEAFHEKKEKNKRKNVIIKRKDRMHEKYGKPITRGQKPKRKK
jgi:ATP-dependent RNA helicase RhlE